MDVKKLKLSLENRYSSEIVNTWEKLVEKLNKIEGEGDLEQICDLEYELFGDCDITGNIKEGLKMKLIKGGKSDSDIEYGTPSYWNNLVWERYSSIEVLAHSARFLALRSIGTLDIALAASSSEASSQKMQKQKLKLFNLYIALKDFLELD